MVIESTKTIQCRACGGIREGRVRYCPPCRKAYLVAYTVTHRVDKAAYDAAYYERRRARRIAQSAQRRRRLLREQPDEMRRQRRAGMAVSYALRTGRLVKPLTCQHCGTAGVFLEAAHRDYTPPYLNIEWLCRSCHRRWDHAQPKGARKD